MNRFSIAQMASYSGLTAFTIRAWEKRYQALSPGRSEGNTRHYSGQQLKRLLNIVSLSAERYKPSKLCMLSDNELQQLIAAQELKEMEGTEGFFISQLVHAGMSFDEGHFSDQLSHCLLRFGVRDAYLKVIYPMLTRVGLMWRCDTFGIAQEHFISQLLKQKLMTAIDLLPLPDARARDGGWLLFLPEDEFHDLGLLIAHYLIRQSGQRSVCLGANVPIDTIQDAVASLKPSAIFMHKVVNRHIVDKNFLQRLARSAGGIPVFIAGLSPDVKLDASWKIHGLGTVAGLEKILVG